MKTIALIPARGGSKRIPGKNLKPFLGEPVISHPIRAALASGCFDRVIVSTDSEVIALHAMSRGAEAPFCRPPLWSGDESPLSVVVSHALGWLAGRDAYCPDRVCVLLPTSVFATPVMLRHVCRIKAPAVVSLTPVGVPFERTFIKKGRYAKMVCPEAERMMSQDFVEHMRDAAQFYLLDVKAFRRTQSLFPPGFEWIEYGEGAAIDMDTPDQWRLAELVYKARRA